LVEHIKPGYPVNRKVDFFHRNPQSGRICLLGYSGGSRNEIASDLFRKGQEKWGGIFIVEIRTEEDVTG